MILQNRADVLTKPMKTNYDRRYMNMNLIIIVFFFLINRFSINKYHRTPLICVIIISRQFKCYISVKEDVSIICKL